MILMIFELNSDDILKIVTNKNKVGSGVFGMVYEYDDTTLIKFYYKDIFRFFTSKDVDDLNNEVDINLFVEQEMLEMRADYVTKKDKLINIMNCLNKAGCSLIKGVVLYQGYPIGILLNYYRGYSKLEDVFEDFDEKNRLLVMNKIKSILFHLFDCGVYPLDLKESNILVNVENLDVQFIDLDGDETRYGDKTYIDEFNNIKKDAVKAFEIMEQRLKIK